MILSTPEKPSKLIGAAARWSRKRFARKKACTAFCSRFVTRVEFDLLAALATSPRRAFTRRQLNDEVWGADWYGDEHIVDVHIGHLRRKVGDVAADPTFIRTVRGVGYGMARP